MNLTATRTTKAHPPVSGTCRMVVAPICPCVILPHGQSGTIKINDRSYALAYVTIQSDEGPQITGYRLLTGEAQMYDLPADLSSCDCPDGTYRTRKDGCKHKRALAALRVAGKLA